MSMKPRDKLGPKRGPGKPSKASKLGKPRSIKNEIRSVERLLRKVTAASEHKLKRAACCCLHACKLSDGSLTSRG
jgi:hypothetical protein